MTEVFKVTDAGWVSGVEIDRDSLNWGPNVTHEISSEQKKSRSKFLCAEGYLHAYPTKEIAELMHWVHVDYENAVLWRAEGLIAHEEPLKVGCNRLTTLELIEFPNISLEQRIEIAIRLFQYYEKGTDPDIKHWCEQWLSNKNRTSLSAKLMHQKIPRLNIIDSWSVYPSILFSAFEYGKPNPREKGIKYHVASSIRRCAADKEVLQRIINEVLYRKT